MKLLRYKRLWAPAHSLVSKYQEALMPWNKPMSFRRYIVNSVLLQI